MCNSFQLNLQINPNCINTTLHQNTQNDGLTCVKQHCFELARSPQQQQWPHCRMTSDYLPVHTCTRSTQTAAWLVQLPIITTLYTTYAHFKNAINFI